ncbi:hypothetical protein AMK25_29625 [Micromonospora sp. TSRI0369]|nr:hypothetical protein AMK25_29625 [Micromonospora sp. TSRI0369]
MDRQVRVAGDRVANRAVRVGGQTFGQLDGQVRISGCWASHARGRVCVWIRCAYRLGCVPAAEDTHAYVRAGILGEQVPYS